MFGRVSQLVVLAGGALLAFGASADAAPYFTPRMVQPGVRPVAYPTFGRNFTPGVMPGSDPRTWSPYPLNPNPGVMPGSDPRTWSPYPLYPTSSYRPYYDNGPIPYWLQNPNWRATMPSVSVIPNPIVYPNPYPYPMLGYNENLLNPYGAGIAGDTNSYNLFR